jgi:hypothetical protein
MIAKPSRVIGSGPCRAEETDAGADFVERREGTPELVIDAVENRLFVVDLMRTFEKTDLVHR